MEEEGDRPRAGWPVYLFLASPMPDMVSKQSTDEHVPFALGRRGSPKESLGIFRFSWRKLLTTGIRTSHPPPSPGRLRLQIAGIPRTALIPPPEFPPRPPHRDQTLG